MNEYYTSKPTGVIISIALCDRNVCFSLQPNILPRDLLQFIFYIVNY